MEQIEKEIDELKTYKGKWINLYITTKGQFRGTLIHDSEGAALETCQRWISGAEEVLAKSSHPLGIAITSGGKRIYNYPMDYITTIQMPIGEGEE